MPDRSPSELHRSGLLHLVLVEAPGRKPLRLSKLEGAAVFQPPRAYNPRTRRRGPSCARNPRDESPRLYTIRSFHCRNAESLSTAPEKRSARLNHRLPAASIRDRGRSHAPTRPFASWSVRLSGAIQNRVPPPFF